MFLSNNNQFITEQYQFDPQQEQPQDQDQDGQDQIEFANIKLYILYNKFIALNDKIDILMTIVTDDELNKNLAKLHEFIKLCRIYYGTLSYNQLLSLLDNITKQLVVLFPDLDKVLISQPQQVQPAQGES